MTVWTQAAGLISIRHDAGMSGFTQLRHLGLCPRHCYAALKSATPTAETSQSVDGASTSRRTPIAHWPRYYGIERRLPYRSDPTVRKMTNEGRMQCGHLTLSRVAQHVVRLPWSS